MLSEKKHVRYYSESEAAQTLCISLESLHKILDNHVFTPDNPRPEEIELTYADLLLLSVWAKPERDCKILEMPTRD